MQELPFHSALKGPLIIPYQTHNIKIAPEMSYEGTLMAQEAMKRDILLNDVLQKEATK